VGLLTREGHCRAKSGTLKSGDIYPESLTINAFRCRWQTAHYVALFSDISEIKEHEQQLEHIAHFDALTGLPNRVLFADRLRQPWPGASQQAHAGVAHFDLDDSRQSMTATATRWGWTADRDAFRMKRALREGTPWPGWRDEFAAVMWSWTIPTACAGLNRLLQAASEEAQIGRLRCVSRPAPESLFIRKARRWMPTFCFVNRTGDVPGQTGRRKRHCEFDPGRT